MGRWKYMAKKLEYFHYSCDLMYSKRMKPLQVRRRKNRKNEGIKAVEEREVNEEKRRR